MFGKKDVYLVFDGRARYDLDSAVVCATAESLDEAYALQGLFGDTVVFRAYDINGVLAELEMMPPREEEKVEGF